MRQVQFSTVFVVIVSQLSTFDFIAEKNGECRTYVSYFIVLPRSCQKQPSRAVPIKRCSESIQQIYSRTPILKSDFNKVAKEPYKKHTSACVFSCKFAVYFQNILPLEHLWRSATVLLKTAWRVFPAELATVALRVMT